MEAKMAESAQIDKVSYTHEAIVDWLICNPQYSLGECAKHFGYTQPWLSTVLNSDAFKVYYNQRRSALNLVINGSISSQLQATTRKALQLIEEKLDDPEDLDGNFILDVADKLLHRQGFAPGKVSLTQNNTVNIPLQGSVDNAPLTRARNMMRAIQVSTGHDPDIIDIVPEDEVQVLQSLSRQENAI